MKSLYKLLTVVMVMVFMLGSLPARQAYALVNPVVQNTNNKGVGSLRWAVKNAAAGSTITFDPSLAGQTIELVRQIQIGTDNGLTIDGSGLDPRIKISGGLHARVFNVTGSYDVYISHLDIIDGYTDDGGGIYNASNTLTLTDVNFFNNSVTANGGAIFNGGNLTVIDSTFLDNSAALGGAIYNFHYSMAVNNSTFTNNTVTAKGGAIYNNETFAGVTITGSTFSSNKAWELHDGEGGAIYNQGTVASITTSTFTGNKSDKHGGGIFNNGTITSIETSTLSGNTALQDGGGIYNNFGSTISSLERSTISGNSAGDDGGGILNNTSGASLLVVNSTISGNNAYNRGGGIMSEGQLDVTNATFSGNGAFQGGGIYAVDAVTQEFQLTNTILANSTSGGDCYNLSGDTITTNINNLIETNSLTPHMCGTPFIEADPKLRPLANNGFKQAKTHMLKLKSPALDAGDDIYCPVIDQRGEPRPVDGNADGSIICDIGAVERQRTLEMLKYRSKAAYDGQVLETGENSNVGGNVNDFDFNMKVGDDLSNKQFRSILSFYTNSLPDRAVVSRVIIKVKKAAVRGTNPFDYSDLVADIRKGSFSNNKVLQSTDFQAFANMNASGIFNNTPLNGGWYKVVLKPKALRYIYKKGITQFRLRFTLDDNNNSMDDHIMFYTGDADSYLNRPLLNVQYYLP